MTSQAAEHDKQHPIHINVNSRPKEVAQAVISYDELVDLAFPMEPQRREILYKIQFTAPHFPDGTVGLGQVQKIENGMKFDVTPTNRS